MPTTPQAHGGLEVAIEIGGTERELSYKRPCNVAPKSVSGLRKQIASQNKTTLSLRRDIAVASGMLYEDRMAGLIWQVGGKDAAFCSNRTFPLWCWYSMVN